jgi:hypothetical protein
MMEERPPRPPSMREQDLQREAQEEADKKKQDKDKQDNN